MNRPKLPSLKSLKAKAWKVFAKAMRQKGADENGWIGCISCHRRYPVGSRAWNAGHFKHGKWKMSGFYENNIWPQCVNCNLGGGKNSSGDLITEIYEQALIKKLGIEEVENIKFLSKQIWKPTRSELEALIEKYSLISEERLGANLENNGR